VIRVIIESVTCHVIIPLKVGLLLAGPFYCYKYKLLNPFATDLGAAPGQPRTIQLVLRSERVKKFTIILINQLYKQGNA